MVTHPSPHVSITGLSHVVDGVQILSDIDLSLSEKRIGVVGRNGSGKTSLARLIAGLITPSSGAVVVDGCDVAKDRKGALAKIGLLFQNPDHQIIFPTVGEEIAFGLTQMGVAKSEVQARVAAVLDQFDRSHWTNAAIYQLSQGQRQLVCLMSVLVMSPSLIILDEPFAGLDIPTTRQLERVINSLAVSVVQITHAPDAVRGYDRVIWLDKGRIVRDGTPGQVLGSFTAEMESLGAGNDLTHLAS